MYSKMKSKVMATEIIRAPVCVFEIIFYRLVIKKSCIFKSYLHCWVCYETDVSNESLKIQPPLLFLSAQTEPHNDKYIFLRIHTIYKKKHRQCDLRLVVMLMHCAERVKCQAINIATQHLKAVLNIYLNTVV